MSAAAAVSGPEREVGSMNKLRETAAFLRYAINPRKAKAAVLAGQCVTLMMLIGCRAQMARDTNRFEADLEALRAAHATEIQQITKQAEDGIYATQYLSSRYEGGGLDAGPMAGLPGCPVCTEHGSERKGMLGADKPDAVG